MDSIQTSDSHSPEPSRPRSVFDGFRRLEAHPPTDSESEIQDSTVLPTASGVTQPGPVVTRDDSALKRPSSRIMRLAQSAVFMRFVYALILALFLVNSFTTDVGYRLSTKVFAFAILVPIVTLVFFLAFSVWDRLRSAVRGKVETAAPRRGQEPSKIASASAVGVEETPRPGASELAQQVGLAAEPQTMVLPMTEAVRTAILESRPPTRPTGLLTSLSKGFGPIDERIYPIVLLILAASGGYMLVASLSSGSLALESVGFFSVWFLFLGIKARSYFSRADTLNRDAAEGTYLRTTGPAVLLHLRGEDLDEYQIAVLSHTLKLEVGEPSRLAPELREKVAYGLFGTGSRECELHPAPISVDYTEHDRLLLEVRDGLGNLIYRHPKYKPD